jgi:hypothetical protein
MRFSRSTRGFVSYLVTASAERKVRDPVDWDERAVEDRVRQLGNSCSAGVEIVGVGGEQVDRLTHVPPGSACSCGDPAVRQA